MKKLFSIGLYVSFFSPIHAMYGIYDIDPHKINSFIMQGKKNIPDNPIFKEFLKDAEPQENGYGLCPPFKRELISLEEFTFNKLKDFFYEFRAYGTYMNMPHIKNSHPIKTYFLEDYFEKYFDIFKDSHFSNFQEHAEHLNSFNGDKIKCKNYLAQVINQYIKDLQEGSIIKDLDNYNKLGEWRTHYIKGFFNQHVMGIEEEWNIFNMSEKASFFNIAKESGFLVTSIDTLSQFQYDPNFSVSVFLSDHPEISSIVLGCGHTRGREYYEKYLKVPNESQCGSCDDLHEGELTIGLSARIDNCDIPANMHQLNLYPNYFSVIKDHSYSVSIQKDETLKMIRDALKPAGVFEIDTFCELKDIHEHQDVTIQKVTAIGFQFDRIEGSKYVFKK